MGDWLIGPMNVFTFTGTAEFFLLVMPAIYWCWDSRLGLRVGIAILISIAVNLILKSIFHDPRPYWADPRVRLLTEPETSFGVPSGHAQTSVVIWGLLAAYFKKPWAWLVAVIIVFFTGVSRVYLGVHFPTDVLAGWILGVVILALFLALEDGVTAGLNRMSESTQIALIWVLSVGIILIGAWVTTGVNSSWLLPADWVQNAAGQAPDAPITPFSLENLIITTGTLFGLAAGAILFNARSGFEAGGPWPKRVARYMIGVVGVLVLWLGLGVLFDMIAARETPVGYLLCYVLYAIVGAWISALGPFIFLQLRLAETDKPG
jgi:hypothetical protein